MAKAKTENTFTTPEVRLRATVWVETREKGNVYDILLERGGSSWRYKEQHVKVGADNLTPRHLGLFLQTAAKMFPREMYGLALSAIRDADANCALDSQRCPHCPVSGSCTWCSWTDQPPEDES